VAPGGLFSMGINDGKGADEWMQHGQAMAISSLGKF
jgi:hypothetical protein